MNVAVTPPPPRNRSSPAETDRGPTEAQCGETGAVAEAMRAGARIWRIGDAARQASGPSDWPHRCARELLAAPWNEAIQKVLERLALWSEADRAWMFEYSPDLSQFRNTQEWSRDGVSTHVDDLQNTPVTIMGELQAHMLAGSAVMVEDVARMPSSMRSLQREFQRQSIRSTLTVPVHHGGRLRAAIGLDAVRAYRNWGPDVGLAMLRIADLVGEARFGKRSPAVATDGRRFPPLFYLRTGRRIRGAALDQIALLRADGDHSIILLTDGSTASDDRPLKWWSAVLPPTDFMRVHRSAIVQVPLIVGLSRDASGQWRAHICNIEQTQSVSRHALADLRSRLGL